MKRIRKPRWLISENRTTPESVFWNRRRVLAAGGGLFFYLSVYCFLCLLFCSDKYYSSFKFFIFSSLFSTSHFHITLPDLHGLHLLFKVGLT